MSDRSDAARPSERSRCRCDINIPPWHRRSRSTFISLPARSVIRKPNRCDSPAIYRESRPSDASTGDRHDVSHETVHQPQHMTGRSGEPGSAPFSMSHPGLIEGTVFTYPLRGPWTERRTTLAMPYRPNPLEPASVTFFTKEQPLIRVPELVGTGRVASPPKSVDRPGCETDRCNRMPDPSAPP